MKPTKNRGVTTYGRDMPRASNSQRRTEKSKDALDPIINVDRCCNPSMSEVQVLLTRLFAVSRNVFRPSLGTYYNSLN